MLRAGQLRTRLRLEVAIETDDAMGHQTLSWPRVATVWARVKPLIGDEYIEAAKMDADVTHEVTIRYRSDVTTSHRFRVEGALTRILHIRSVLNPDERGEALVLMCSEDV